MDRELLISRELIQERVRELADQISSDYAGQEPVFIGILNGVVFFFADLLRELKIEASMDFIRASSYGSQTASSGVIRLSKEVELSVSGKPLIVVEDIVDTGLTLAHIVRDLERKSPDSIRVCVLIDKLERREKTVHLDYVGFQIEKGFVVGYGLDCDERYRHLPDIHVLTS